MSGRVEKTFTIATKTLLDDIIEGAGRSRLSEIDIHSLSWPRPDPIPGELVIVELSGSNAQVLNRIWAPWRAHYIQSTSGTAQPDRECFLCSGLASALDRENLVVERTAHSMVVLNRFPYNNGHLLVAPRAHRGTLGELDGRDLLEPLETIRRMTVVLDRMLRPQGYNIGLNQGKAAGAGLPGHLHWHIVPRWDGDSNFMPILADTKVIVESLNDFYDRLLVELGRDQS